MPKGSKYIEDVSTHNNNNEAVKISQEIGAAIQKARAALKQSLEDVSQALKIQVKYLQAIESGDPSKMPSSFYYLSFIKSYSQYLKLDIEDLYKRLRQFYQHVGVYTGDSTSILMQSRYNRWSASILISILVLFFIILTFSFFYIFIQDPSVKKTEDAPVVISPGITGSNQVTIVAAEKTHVKLTNNLEEVIFSGYIEKNQTKTFYTDSGMTMSTEGVDNLTVFVDGVPVFDLSPGPDQKTVTILRGPALIKND